MCAWLKALLMPQSRVETYVTQANQRECDDISNLMNQLAQFRLAVRKFQEVAIEVHAEVPK